MTKITIDIPKDEVTNVVGALLKFITQGDHIMQELSDFRNSFETMKSAFQAALDRDADDFNHIKDGIAGLLQRIADLEAEIAAGGDLGAVLADVKTGLVDLRQQADDAAVAAGNRDLDPTFPAANP